MKKNLIIEKKSHLYIYECSKCGNEIYKYYEISPKKCFNCNSKNTFNSKVETVSIEKQYCPICNNYFQTSTYLALKIKDKHVLWLANMVTHHRHDHINWWNKMWGDYGQYYSNGWYHYSDYDSLKIKVNEQAKRQILRKCKQYMIDNGFTVEHVKQLQNTDEKTIALYEKHLGAIPEFQDVLSNSKN